MEVVAGHQRGASERSARSQGHIHRRLGAVDRQVARSIRGHRTAARRHAARLQVALRRQVECITRRQLARGQVTHGVQRQCMACCARHHPQRAARLRTPVVADTRLIHRQVAARDQHRVMARVDRAERGIATRLGVEVVAGHQRGASEGTVEYQRCINPRLDDIESQTIVAVQDDIPGLRRHSSYGRITCKIEVDASLCGMGLRQMTDINHHWLLRCTDTAIRGEFGSHLTTTHHVDDCIAIGQDVTRRVQ